MSSLEPDNPSSPPAAGPYGQDAQLAPSLSVRATMDQMTDRMQMVIEAAERAAEAIRNDAEEQARLHLAEAQRKADRMTAERVRMISALTDDLIRHAGQVREHSEQMVESLENAIASVSGKLEDPGVDPAYHEGDDVVLEGSSPSLGLLPSPVEEAEEPPAAAEPFEGDAEAEAIQDEPAPPEPEWRPVPAPPIDPTPRQSPLRGTPISQEALLHATRLAAAGNDRESISTVLREQFGVTDPAPVLDRVLGVGQG